LVRRLYMFRAAFLRETCRVIPIKLEFSASVGFIHFNMLLIVYSTIPTGIADVVSE
jgi:hypothetical protein